MRQAIHPEPAALVRDGGVIATGLDAELDELRAIQTNCDGFLLDLELREKARTGIAMACAPPASASSIKWLSPSSGKLGRQP